MLEFILSNYVIFIVIAVVLLLGLFGYMMDRKKYEQYREELVQEDRALSTLEAAPAIDSIAQPVPVAPSAPVVPSMPTPMNMSNDGPAIDPLTGSSK